MNNREKIIGTYSQGKGDFGFVDVENIDKGFFVLGRNKNKAFDGDKVEAELKEFNGKKEAIITNILERKNTILVGEFIKKENDNFGFVKLKNPNIRQDIFIVKKRSFNAKNGYIVGVKILNWVNKNPEGQITEIIGRSGDKNLKINSLIIEGGSKLKFPYKVIDASKNITRDFKNNRTDLTNLFTFTIDGADAKDLDDAISIEKIDEGYKLYVHIADVANYVTEKSIIDIEAYKRATSVYLVDRVIPMLPEKLSNDLCSLNPNTKKLTITCEMIIGNNGQLKSQKVYESIIKSDHRLTYKQVDEILSNDIIKNENLKQTLQIANKLKEKIINFRESNGVLNFDFPETKIKLDKKNKPISIEVYPRYESNKMIEEFMISANTAVSREFSSLPFLYRIHEKPSLDDISKLQDTLNLFGIKFIFQKNNTSEFSKLLGIIEKQDDNKKSFLEKMVLRTLTKAVYSKENFGHFGLGLSFYSHFTSPIRRYSDLQIHRIIKEKISKKLDKKRQIHYEEILKNVAHHISDNERKAERLEYKIRDYFTCIFYKDKIGQVFNANISSVLKKGIFVSLEDTTEGFIELKNTNFLDELQEHIDLSTGKKYRLADNIKVKLIEVDQELLRLNFEFTN